LSVLLNQGNGSFAAQIAYPVDTAPDVVGPDAIAAADLNGDGKLDLVTANYGGGTVSVLLNQGNGSFAPKVAYGAGVRPVAIAAADLTGDGIPDLAVANSISETVNVMANQGNSSFAGPVFFAVELGPSSIVAADWNGDGMPPTARSEGIGKANGFRSSRGRQETAPPPTAVDITLNPRSTHRTEKLCSSGMFVDLVPARWDLRAHRDAAGLPLNLRTRS
jgi:hypothetical protein